MGRSHSFERSHDGVPCENDHRWALIERAREGGDTGQKLKCRKCGARKVNEDSERATRKAYDMNPLDTPDDSGGEDDGGFLSGLI